MTSIMDFTKRTMKLSGDVNELNLLISDMRNFLFSIPLQRGVADGLYHLGTLLREAGINHDYEAYSLMAYRLRETLIDQRLGPYILINLCNACVFQKSFEEAYKYGVCARVRLKDYDADLSANMALACTFTGRDIEAQEELEKLKKRSPDRAAEIIAALCGEGTLHPTQDIDCTNIYKEMLEIQKQWNRRVDPEHALTQLRELTIELLQYPDGKDAWKSWCLLGEFNMVNAEPIRSEMEALYSTATATAAFGKAIAFYPRGMEVDPVLLTRYGQGLGQLGLYTHAIYTLEEALFRASGNYRLEASITNSLQYCREMAFMDWC